MSFLLLTVCFAPSLAMGAVLLLPAGRVRALAAASIVVSGVAFSLYATLSPSQSSTVADQARTVGKVDRVAAVAPEPPQETFPVAVLAPSIEASRTDFAAPSVKISDFPRPSIEVSATAFVAPSIEASRRDLVAPSVDASHFLPPSIEASETAFYEVAKEASDDRTAVETISGPSPAGVAARVERPVDQASLDQSAPDQHAPASKSSKQKNPKTTAKKPVSRDRANFQQHHHAKAVAAPEANDQAIGSNQEPATFHVQEAPSAGAFGNPMSKLRELFGTQ